MPAPPAVVFDELEVEDASDFPDPREDPKSRSLNGGSYKVHLVV